MNADTSHWFTWSDPHPEAEGRLADIASDWGVTQQEACRRLQPGGACYFQMHEDDVERVIAHPLSMIGSDGLPSARNFKLHRRGQIQAGWYADIVVFDPARVRDRASYEQPLEVSEGNAAVYVNGVPSWGGDARASTGRAGRWLERTCDGSE